MKSLFLFLLFSFFCSFLHAEGETKIVDGSFTVPKDDIKIEYEIRYFQSIRKQPGVVLCHPDPRLGGSFNNHIVSAIAHELAGKGYFTLKFNFRGVGKSEGSFAEGKGEQRDIKAALEKLRSFKEVDSENIYLAGYSFGSAMAFEVAIQDQKLKAYAGIGYPNDYFKHKASEQKHGKLPVLMVGGLKDPWCKIHPLGAAMKKGGFDIRTIAVAETDHFFTDRKSLDRAVSGVVEFFEAVRKGGP
ncbi:MAG: alpha/beta fold hydrolase [Planctomycetota bacterium]|jgi:alpha/beta superfamily hydrolase|nr:alpha/beta fold hydrolase [Planctomycetota bacterium]MDP7250211.1 alpha/beta fold hydrolase [Planctomycetota bacterium]